MSRAVVSAALLLSTFATHAARAQEVPDDDTVSAAAEAGVSATDLLGAMNSTGLEARQYLAAVGELAVAPPTPPAAHGYSARVRLTYYAEAGVTYSGGHTYAGSTACSWNFSLGTKFRLPDNEVFTCNDRGQLGSTGWLDLFRRPDLTRTYGPFATVEVIP